MEVPAKVAEVFQARYTGIHALTFGDQLATHRRVDIFGYALGLGTPFLPLQEHTSHITLPLGEALFGTMPAEKVRRD